MWKQFRIVLIASDICHINSLTNVVQLQGLSKYLVSLECMYLIATVCHKNTGQCSDVFKTSVYIRRDHSVSSVSGINMELP